MSMSSNHQAQPRAKAGMSVMPGMSVIGCCMLQPRLGLSGANPAQASPRAELQGSRPGDTKKKEQIVLQPRTSFHQLRRESSLLTFRLGPVKKSHTIQWWVQSAASGPRVSGSQHGSREPWTMERSPL